jgi:hypothetical protein
VRKRLSALLHELRPLLVPVAAATVVAIAAALGWAAWSYRRMHEAALDARYIPSYREPGPGRRAPSSDAFGLRVGGSTLTEVQAQLARMGLQCPDTSIRALMARSRADRMREIEERKRQGQPVDDISRASSLRRRSPMEHNPQVRLSCENVVSTRLTDRPRPISTGRLLFVFDNAERPLRHASFARTLGDPASGRSEVAAAVAAYTARFGRPTRTPPAEPAAPAPGSPPQPAGALPWLAPVDYEWTFADLTVRVSALNFGGGRGTTLTELIEVPLPIRPDAPTHR